MCETLFKVVLRGKCVASNTRLEKSDISNLSFHLKQLLKGSKVKPKQARRKEIVKMQA